jgi:ABC-type dipeptide/oligopeptide/nickel transport systems, permease components
MAILTIYLVATLTFFLMYLVPGGPFLAEKTPSQATLDALYAKYGLDKPVIVQYKNYMVNLLHGDLGLSLKQRGRTVNDIIATGFPVSAKVGGISVIIAFVVGVPLGSVAALKRGKWVDNVIIVLSSAGVAIPSFVISTVLMYVFSVKLQLLPTFGLTSFKNYIMPVTALSFYPTCYIARLMRSSMLDVMGQDYMRTARAKGLNQFTILFKHALRNAIAPVVTYLGPLIAYTLTGSFVVERIFTIPGIGREFISSTVNRDYTMIMGLTIFLAALIVVMNTAVDIINKAIDPRIKLK